MDGATEKIQKIPAAMSLSGVSIHDNFSPPQTGAMVTLKI
jgi:hypothetical protein